jgi:NitT/TauT family transport system substrate-binding protein
LGTGSIGRTVREKVSRSGDRSKGVAARWKMSVDEGSSGRWSTAGGAPTEAAVRFYALWLRDVGMIKTPPQKVLAQGTDWRFPDELKRELRG